MSVIQQKKKLEGTDKCPPSGGILLVIVEIFGGEGEGRNRK
jgi:hypothetical protein